MNFLRRQNLIEINSGTIRIGTRLKCHKLQICFMVQVPYKIVDRSSIFNFIFFCFTLIFILNFLIDKRNFS